MQSVENQNTRGDAPTGAVLLCSHPAGLPFASAQAAIPASEVVDLTPVRARKEAGRKVVNVDAVVFQQSDNRGAELSTLAVVGRDGGTGKDPQRIPDRVGGVITVRHREQALDRELQCEIAVSQPASHLEAVRPEGTQPFIADAGNSPFLHSAVDDLSLLTFKNLVAGLEQTGSPNALDRVQHGVACNKLWADGEIARNASETVDVVLVDGIGGCWREPENTGRADHQKNRQASPHGATPKRDFCAHHGVTARASQLLGSVGSVEGDLSLDRYERAPRSPYDWSLDEPGKAYHVGPMTTVIPPDLDPHLMPRVIPLSASRPSRMEMMRSTMLAYAAIGFLFAISAAAFYGAAVRMPEIRQASIDAEGV